METSGGVATWLELAAVPRHHARERRVTVHSVGGEESSCYAISVDGRWVCAGTGEVTVFRGMDAALHFLEILRVNAFHAGARAEPSLMSASARYCMQGDQERGLSPCEGCGAATGYDQAPPH